MHNPIVPARNLLYILQIEEYHLGRFWRWIKTHREWQGLEKKKKLVWTTKAQFLYALSLAIAFGLSFVLLFLAWIQWHSIAVLVFAAIIALLLLQYVIAGSLILSFFILEPFVRALGAVFIFQARRTRNTFPHLKVIGISGSFGKTSIKEILATLARHQCKTLKSPENVNTLLGIARVMLRKLEKTHEVFIAEIGAYRRGDTRAVAKLIQPRIGVLVGINEQHLERFGSMENIIATESELFETLPKGGLAVVYRDDPYCAKVKAHIPEGVRVIDFSIHDKEAGRFRIEYLAIDERGIRFDLSENDTKYHFESKLLGAHNVVNVLAALLAAHYGLGIALPELGEALKAVQAPPHRLELLRQTVNGGDIIILDDSYNINPSGARAALEVLALFRERRKIVLTHGLVELGEFEEKIHKEFGILLSRSADLVIAAGPKVPLIEKSLREQGFPSDRFIVAKDINEAVARWKLLAQPGDVVLIQTDLPDSYY